MKRLAKIKNLIENFENQPICFENWLVIFIAIISVRLLEEIFLNLKKVQSEVLVTNNFIWHDFIHIFLIFAFVNLVSFFIFEKTLKLKLSAFLNISLLSTLFLSTIPPFLDFLISKKHNLINFYEFYSPREILINFFTFMQQNPFIGTTPGQRIGILISIILVGFYTFLKTQKFWLSLLNTFLFYGIFFFVSTLPSLITFLVKGFQFKSPDVASLFFAPTDLLNQTAVSVDISLHKKMILSYFALLFLAFFFISLKNKLFQALLKNIRLTQTFYHLGLLSVGFAISIIFNQAILIFNFFNFLSLFLIALVTILMWFSSVIINDYFDEEIDKITNQQRPLITKIILKKTYLKIGITTFFIALLITFFINISLTIWFSFYYALTLIYNVPPLRLKRFLGLATFLSALASVIIIFIGYLSITPENSLQNFPSSLIYLFLITFTISLPLKDFKDIEGDRKNKVFTLPVIFGEKNGRFILGINFFISYFLSVYFLQEKKLFFPALVFGTINFLTINLKFKENYLFSQKKITPVIFSLVFFYGIILVYTIFKNNLIEFFKF